MSGANASDIVKDYTQLLRRPLDVPQVAAPVLSADLPPRDNRPCAVILAPHPDDECLMGGLALRLQRELGWQIITVAVTLGSDAARRAARRNEWTQACAVLGFDGVLSDDNGFSGVTAQTRDADNVAWAKMVSRLAVIIAHCQPQAVFMPHAGDAHPTHSGTHHLGMEALAKQKTNFECKVILTEYWQPHDAPNVMIGLGAADVATLLTALTCHVGENRRNNYAARFPAYLIDNVRRGAERVGSAGAAAPQTDFAMLYHFGIWKNHKFIASALHRIIGAEDALSDWIDA